MATPSFDITSGLPADMFHNGLTNLPPSLFHQDASTIFSNSPATTGTPPVLSALPSPMPPPLMLVNGNTGLHASVPTPNLLYTKLIADITCRDHANFLDNFQERFEIVHRLKDKHFGDQIKWAWKNVVRDFIKKFGPVSTGFAIKADHYLRNRSIASKDKGTRRVSGGKPTVSTRAVQWIHVMGREMKDTVEARMTEIHKAKGITSKGDYLKHFKEACDEIVEELDQLKIDKFKAIADAETVARKSPPTPENVYDRQGSMVNVVSDAISDNFGWEAGQVGDAVCVFTLAYVDPKDQIKTDISFVSNKYILNTDCNVPMIISAFHEHIDPLLKSLTNEYLPASVPQVLIDYENMTMKQLRGSLYEVIMGQWVASSSNGSPQNATLFVSMDFVHPATTSSFDKLSKLAQALNSLQASPLFRKAEDIVGPTPFIPNPPITTQTPVASDGPAIALRDAPSAVIPIESVPHPVAMPVMAAPAMSAPATSAVPDLASVAKYVNITAPEASDIAAVDDHTSPPSILGKHKRGNVKASNKPPQVIYVPEPAGRVLRSHADKGTPANQLTKEIEDLLEENQVLKDFEGYKKVIIPHVDDFVIGLVAQQPPLTPRLSPCHPVDDLLLMMSDFVLTD
ncbi:hypothetical protein NP233_g7530 [Leucocoprinus birnbaumii]|uniref:Uncharacterized protein n=1 Tax=Leucocoprinus birnbaumii TaxID=56174 RepID=A0AAD5VUI6_9AGAR|nr:hypothetical protein NP233_g7530 [Leucocoprinus birnbaumii]